MTKKTKKTAVAPLVVEHKKLPQKMEDTFTKPATTNILSLPESMGSVHESSIIPGSLLITKDEYIKMKRSEIPVVVVAGKTAIENKYYMLPRKI